MHSAIHPLSLAQPRMSKVGELLQKQLEEHRQQASLMSDEGMDFCDDSSSDSDDSGLESLVNGKTNRSAVRGDLSR